MWLLHFGAARGLFVPKPSPRAVPGAIPQLACACCPPTSADVSLCPPRFLSSLLTRAPVAGYGAVGGQDVIICAIGSLAMDDPVVLRPVIEDDLPGSTRMRNDP